jgi:hypothetical protein
MKLLRSKSWYEKKAKLEPNSSIAAGRFPSEIFDTKADFKVVLKSKSKATTTAKPATAFHKVRRSK